MERLKKALPMIAVAALLVLPLVDNNQYVYMLNRQ